MTTETNTTETTTENTNPRRKGKKPSYAPGVLVRALVPQRRALEFTGVVENHGKFRINDAGEAVPDENSSESLYVIKVTEAPEEQYEGRTFLLANNKIVGTVEELAARDEERASVTTVIETALVEHNISFRPDARQKNPAWILEGTFGADELRQIADLLDGDNFAGIRAKVQINRDSTVEVARPTVTASDIFGDDDVEGEIRESYGNLDEDEDAA